MDVHSQDTTEGERLPESAPEEGSGSCASLAHQLPESSVRLCDTPLTKAIQQYASRVPMALRHRMRYAIGMALPCLHQMKVSSACSGCDIAFLCAEKLCSYWSVQLGEPCSLVHGFACEHLPEKQEFLKSQFALQELYDDVSDLSKVRATDLLSGRMCFLSSCFIFSAGFSCRSRTPLSSKSSQNRNCLQNHQQDAETSYTFDFILEYIQKQRPVLAILENVPALLQKDVSTQSDADWVISELMQAGYVARYWKFAAEDFGSRAARTRIYFIGWRLPNIDDPKKMVCHERLLEKLAWLSQLLECMSLDPFPDSEFVRAVVGDAEVAKLFLPKNDEHSHGKAGKAEPKWEEEHCAAFRDQGLAWPMKVTSSVMELEGGSIHKQYLNQRAFELLFFLHTVFAMMPCDEEMQFEYVDVNPTLGRSTQNGNPWRSLCPTITGASQMCVRYRRGSSGRITVRPLSGQECMALIGWSPSFFAANVTMNDIVLRNFAGNAFSAFAYTPMLIVALCGYDIVKTQTSSCLIPRPESPDADDMMLGHGGSPSDSD